MRHRTLFWQIFPSCLLIAFLSVLGVALYASYGFRRLYRETTESDLMAKARLIEGRFHGSFSTAAAETVDALCKDLGADGPLRITVILPSGKVIGDSEEDPGRMDNHGDRPEIAQAVREGAGASVRFSHTLQREMMYVARGVREGGRTVGVIRTSVSLEFIDHALGAIHRRVALAGFLAATLAAGVSLLVSRRISRPLEEIRRGAERFAQGDLGQRLQVSDSHEIGALAAVLNQMAKQLDDRIRMTVEQRNEAQTVLSGMTEGVLAVDTEERIISLNHAAALLLGVDADEAPRKSLLETVRSSRLHRLVAEALAGADVVEDEIALHTGDRDALVHARGTVLRDADGAGIGALVVLNDLTRLRKLESVRRDFVANVSHELRTPITSIKGFVETLLDEAPSDRNELTRFLKIIARQADRLEAIIEDLLTLSQIEEDGEKSQVRLEVKPLSPILETAAQLCGKTAREKSMTIRLDCPEDLQASVNPPLLEQAVANLLDNAVKYSAPETEVRVEARREEGATVIRVRDQGPGIPREHLHRLFERFYRVDKARSRKLGGTGLGLAIVKHIAQVHGGQVTVESERGKGSAFTIRLPR